ncbi:3-oxoacyl-ACP reductase [Rhodococcus sp. ACPA4]|uniref:SDR family NAD(P)-dependent oxidoreductase n=1 Tax=Rhodococcus TaxID=1827 RepID=UPI000BB136DD|nr:MULTISPECIES: SDR family oxidoreductase [Rhodococcus]NRI68545.1 SDR family oxidoreductase [Rhodococcus sp. MS16]PBC43527.1 3-oxoacyl-ACP reductase [Rhodococcus sp. ACPA4]QXW00382.1 SDR family oxidoreductase [Rhodococcus globerulus]
MKTLSGDRALVTGAGQGIGRGVALALADAGAVVAVVGRTRAKLDETVHMISERGGSAFAFECDVTDTDQIDRLIVDVAGRMGGPTILVNNAQTAAHGLLLDLDEVVYQQSLDSGPLATWRLMRLFHPYLVDGGRIVNVGSAAGIRWDPSGFGGYAAAKEAIRVLTRTAACEWASDGIRVNAILPLATSPILDDWARISPEEAAAYVKTVPLGRLGDPETDIGPAVVFLCSSASHYITGHALPVDGGQALVR